MGFAFCLLFTCWFDVYFDGLGLWITGCLTVGCGQFGVWFLFVGFVSFVVLLF